MHCPPSPFPNNICKDDSTLFSRFVYGIHPSHVVVQKWFYLQAVVVVCAKELTIKFPNCTYSAKLIRVCTDQNVLQCLRKIAFLFSIKREYRLSSWKRTLMLSKFFKKKRKLRKDSVQSFIWEMTSSCITLCIFLDIKGNPYHIS